MTLAVSDAATRKRGAVYAFTALILVLAYLPLVPSGWQSTDQVHTLLEALATLLAFLAALAALIRYFSRRSETFLFLSAAFVGAALLDGYHAVVSSAYVSHQLASNPALFPSAIATRWTWSWLLARLVFAFLICQSVLLAGDRPTLPIDGDTRHRRVLLVVSLLALLGCLALLYAPLPPYWTPAGRLARPLELLPFAVFLLALAGALRKGHWARDDFQHWLVLALILSVFVHAPYMVSSRHLADGSFDLAHLLKIASYACVLTGLVLSMLALFRQADASGQVMARANEALRRSQTKLAEAQRLAHIGSWEWDLLTDEVTWSDEMYRVYGYEPGAMTVRLGTFVEFVHPEDRAMVEASIGRSMNDHQPFEFFHRIVRPDGEVRLLQGRGATVVGPDGKVVRMWGTGQDITEQRRAEEALRASEKHFRAVSESAVEAIISTDDRGIIIFWNKAAEAMFGYSEAEVRGQSVAHLMPERFREDHRRAIEQVRGGGETRVIRHTLQVSGLNQDGREFPIELSLSSWDLHGDRYYTAMVRDVTWRKRAESELAEASRRLADSREAERLHLAQDLHDGPLQDLYGVRLHLIELSKGKMTKELTPSAADAGTALAEPQDLLRRIIDQLRSICHELRPPALAPFGLEVAIRSHAERFRAAHPCMHLDLDLDPDKQRLPDRSRLALYRIYQQALENIARHAGADHVYVRLSLSEDRVTLSIRDDGQGFVVPGQWLMLARRGKLGLLGASERAEAIGGRLEVESEPGEGTLISVTAPMTAEAESAIEAPA
jgi:PAS domain S-box-containing protein